MSTYSTILTNTGKARLASAAANGTQVHIVTMEVGDGAGNPQVPSATQTALKRVVYSGTLNSIGQDPNDPTQFIAEFVIPATVGGFSIRELGLRTDDGDLFAVANTPIVYKPSASEGAYSDTIVKMVFKVDNASTVNVVVDPNISIATRTWVINYAVAANIIPGGLSTQVLAKASNNDGDVHWIDPTQGVQVVVDTLEESQTLAGGQTAVNLSNLTTHALAVYVEGVRLRQDEWTATDDTHLTLASSYPDGSRAVFVQNEQTGSTDLLHASNNLLDVANTATARANLGAAASARKITVGIGLSGGGDLTADRTVAVDFAASGTVSNTQAVRADDSRLSDARTPVAHSQDVSTITGTMAVPQGGTGLATLTAGSFLKGNGTNAVTLRTPAQVLSDIGGASASHTHNEADINGLTADLAAKVSKAGDAMTGVLSIFNGTIATQSVKRRIGWDNSVVRWAEVIEGNSSYSLYSYDAGGGSPTQAMTISNIATGNTNATLYGSLTANGGFQNSDRRLKTNIKPRQVQRGFALKIARMFVEWDRIADGVHDVGLIAQRVKRLAARYVKRGDDKRHLLAIDKAGIALEASMDNALELAEHKKTIAALLRRIEKLERRK